MIKALAPQKWLLALQLQLQNFNSNTAKKTIFSLVAPAPATPYPSGTGSGGGEGSGYCGGGTGHYSSVSCDATYTLGKGEFTSPSYPYNYPSNAYCKYLIEQPEEVTITLEFIDMNIENIRHKDADGNFVCNYDFVEVSSNLHNSFPL